MTTNDAPPSAPVDAEPEGRGPLRSSPALFTALSRRSWAGSVLSFVTEGRVRRRPSDVVRLVSALLVIAAAAGWASRAGNLEQTTVDLLAQLPGTGRGLFRTASTLLVVLGLAVGVLALVRRHLRLAGTVLLAGVLAAAVAWAAAGLFDVEGARSAAGLTTPDGSVTEFPAGGLALGTALLLAAVPYLTRPVRRVVATLIPLAGVGTVYLLQGLPSDAVAAIALGWGAAAAAHLAFGTPAGIPSAGAVKQTLAELGVSVDALELAPFQTWGAARFVAEATGGGRLAVRVIGRDATDATLLASLWQAIWYKDRSGGLVLGRAQRVEREAYYLLLAERARVPVPTLLAAGSSGSRDDAVLVVEVPDGSTLAEHDLWPTLLEAVTRARAEATEATLADKDAPPPEPIAVVDIDPSGLEGVVPVADEVLDAMWATLAELHDARLVHGDLCPENLLVQPDGRVVLLDFSRAGPVADELGRRLDRLAMLVASARLAGPVAGVASAQRALGDEDLTDLLPLLQSSSLAAATRRRPAKPKLLIDAIRSETLRRTGAPEPELVELRRVSPADLLMAAATILGIYLLAGELTSVDDLWGTLTSAEPAWVLAVIFCSQMPQFTSAVTVTGAVHAPLPFGRVVMLQFANGFTGLVGGTAANTALVIRFFQKQGLSSGVAVGSGILWSGAGFIAQVVLVTICILIAQPDLSSVRMGTESGGSGTPWLTYLLVVGGLLGVLLAIPAVRRSLTLKVRPQVHEIRRNLRGVVSEPRKAAQLFGGAFGSQIFFALSLDSAVHAYGGTVAFSSVVLTNSFASLVGGLAPIPGGMGVTEAGMIAGLTAAGVPQEIAVAATLLHRTFTYYLPPTWGWGALRWLKNHDAV